MSVFKKTKISHLEQPMFLGESVDVARYDLMRLPWIDKLTEKQLSFFWRPEEVDLSKDRIDFKNLTEAEKFMFISNIKYQTLLDSVQGRAPTEAFGNISSLPELETWVETWAFSETIHSRSYTHIIRNVFDKPSEILDEITLTPEILERADAVTKHYDDLIEYTAYFNLLGEGTHAVNGKTVVINKHELRKKLCLTLASVNILEGVRFYVSFACSWSFAERALMEGNAKVIKLIARDEALHLSGTQLMLQHLASGKDGPEWQDAYEEVLPDILALFDSAVQQEKEWAEYLFSKGSVIGLNPAILHKYVEYIANVRLKAIGLEVRYTTTANPLPWTNSYIQSDNVQVSPQETEITSYLTGAIDSNITEDLSELSL
jgi:ribonucleoside-diphosphate reductase beta chain